MFHDTMWLYFKGVVIKTTVLLKVRKRALSQNKILLALSKNIENLKNYNHIAQYYNTVTKLSHKK